MKPNAHHQRGSDNPAAEDIKNYASRLVAWAPPKNNFNALSMYSDLFYALRETTSGFFNQPRVLEDDDASAVVESIMDLFCSLGERVVEIARETRTEELDALFDAQCRARILLDWECRHGLENPLVSASILNDLIAAELKCANRTSCPAQTKAA